MSFRDLRGLTWLGVFVLALWLSVVVFVSHGLSGFLEALVVKGIMFGWVLLFLWYSVFLFVGLVLFVFMLRAKKEWWR